MAHFISAHAPTVHTLTLCVHTNTPTHTCTHYTYILMYACMHARPHYTHTHYTHTHLHTMCKCWVAQFFDKHVGPVLGNKLRTINLVTLYLGSW